MEFRLDKTANLHVPIGKVSFDEKKLYENLAALMEAIKKASPAAAKGTYIKRITMTSTMGPGCQSGSQPGPIDGGDTSRLHDLRADSRLTNRFAKDSRRCCCPAYQGWARRLNFLPR